MNVFLVAVPSDDPFFDGCIHIPEQLRNENITVVGPGETGTESFLIESDFPFKSYTVPCPGLRDTLLTAYENYSLLPSAGIPYSMMPPVNFIESIIKIYNATPFFRTLKELATGSRIIVASPYHPVAMAAAKLLVNNYDLLLQSSRILNPSEFSSISLDHIYRARSILISQESLDIFRKFYGPGLDAKLQLLDSPKEFEKTNDTEISNVMTRGKNVLKLKRIYQVLTSLVPGDAISDQAIFIHKLLLSRGIESSIIADYYDPVFSDFTESISQAKIKKGSGLIYHHSIASSATEFVKHRNEASLLIYHNITPPHFFKFYNEELADRLYKAENELSNLADKFKASAGVSHFNIQSLIDNGFESPDYLPLPVSPHRWNIPPDPATLRKLDDGRINITFVGRLVPNKRIEDLILMVDELRYERPEIRLCLPGEAVIPSYFQKEIASRIRESELNHHVHIPGKVTQSELLAFYLKSHFYVSMSQHEGFGVPLIEAMWFDIPVVAKNAGAIAETLGNSGLLLSETASPVDCKNALLSLLSSPGRVKKIIEQQRIQREKFLPVNLEENYMNIIKRLFY